MSTLNINVCSFSMEATLAAILTRGLRTTECLDKLYFDKIHSRREKVPEAFLDTNQWIWEHPAYTEWRSTGGLLWIPGKPGSGNSVLAKTIHRNFLGSSLDVTGKGKEGWFVCDWFYSRRDLDIGAAHDSMLRALLHDILNHSEASFEATRQHYRRAWDSLYGDSKLHIWPIEVLEDMLRALSTSF